LQEAECFCVNSDLTMLHDVQTSRYALGFDPLFVEYPEASLREAVTFLYGRDDTQADAR
jgi:hypothetical protein